MNRTVNDFVHPKCLFCSYNKKGSSVKDKNGQTKDITRGHNTGDSSYQPDRLGILRHTSQGDEHNQIGTNSQNSPGGNSSGTNYISGDTSPGKMLQRLEQLERLFREYVEAHQSRLETRLDDSKKQLEKFEEEAAAIRNELYKLAAEEESTSGHNGHTK
jgi:hypothetical protein